MSVHTRKDRWPTFFGANRESHTHNLGGQFIVIDVTPLTDTHIFYASGGAHPRYNRTVRFMVDCGGVSGQLTIRMGAGWT